MDGDQFGAVRESGLDLDVVKHLGDALHDVVSTEHPATADHQFGDGASVAGAFEQVVGEDRDRFGVVEFQAARLSTSRQFSGVGQQQAVLFVRGQKHVRDIATTGGNRQCTRIAATPAAGSARRTCPRATSTVLVVGDGDQPQLLAPAAVNRRRLRRHGAGGDRAQEVGVVVHADHVSVAVGGRARPDPTRSQGFRRSSSRRRRARFPMAAAACRGSATRRVRRRV